MSGRWSVGRGHALWGLAVVGVQSLGCTQQGAPDRTEAPIRLGQTVTSEHGMVVSSSEPAARAGAQVLAGGGNAVDAAVATAFALAVAEPTQSGLGGRTQALVVRPGGESFGVDGTTVVPAGHDPDSPVEVDGYSVIGIPGTVAALHRLWEEAGSMTWAEIVQPALELAEGGFALTEGEAGRLIGIRDRLLLSEGARHSFLKPDGSAYAAGEHLEQPDLARVLRSIADEGPGVFYEGWIADLIVEDVANHGGALTTLDLSGYDAEPSILAHGRFGDLDLVGTYLPASGATTIEALQIVDRLRITALPPDRRVVSIGEALLAAFRDRESAREDERAAPGDAAWITSTELADQRAGEIRLGAPILGAGDEGSESPNTSHISVVDAQGMAVAMTQSLGPTGGSRVATSGLGFLYAATLGYLDRSEPGDRPWSSQSPLVALRDGRVAMVLGGAGARRIVSALVQTLIRIELDSTPVAEAMAAPRMHPTGRWHFEQTDPSAEPAGAELARSRGFTVLVRPFEYYFGRLNIVVVEPDGSMTGVADPRWTWGVAAAPGGPTNQDRHVP